MFHTIDMEANQPPEHGCYLFLTMNPSKADWRIDVLPIFEVRSLRIGGRV
jgi:hypothetical protein